ncbi:MAG: SRPBCC family protein [Chloroflexi bacterium]|nr:SRPBCC family protein [Chloroflexota bacterium]
MARKPVELEIYIDRSPNEVFAYLRDYSNEAKWQSDHVHEARSEPPGPARVGTRVPKARRTPMGVKQFTVEIVEMDEAARKWTDLTINGGFRGTRGRWEVQPQGTGSRVHLRAEMNAPGLMKMLLPLIDMSAKKALNVEFQRLKQVLEALPS